MLLKFKPADMSSGGLVRTGGGSSERSCSGAGGCKVDIDPEKILTESTTKNQNSLTKSKN